MYPYLQNDNQRVYQYKSAPGDGTGKSEDPKESQTRGIIDDEGYRYVVRGVGSRVTFDLSAGGGKAESVVIGKGTEALAGSTLRVDPNKADTEFKVTKGSMIYDGSSWSTSGDASRFRYQTNYMDGIAKKAANAYFEKEGSVDIEPFTFVGVDMKGTAGDLGEPA